jgi:hypothetical protein
MNVWSLMIALCFLMPTAGTIAVIRDAQSGWVAYLVAVIAALLLGACFAWLLHVGGRVVLPRSVEQVKAGSDWPFRLLYLAAAGWLILSLLAGVWSAGFVVGRL